jgi:hypothetical protein
MDACPKPATRVNEFEQFQFQLIEGCQRGTEKIM